MRKPALLLLLSVLAYLPAIGQNYPPVKPGFGTIASPGLILPGAGTIRGHPVVADLGLTPGHKSIIFGTVTGRLYVILWNGTVAPGFPVQLAAPAPPIDSSPAVGDLEGNGIPGIVVGYGSIYDRTKRGGMVAYRRNGTFLWNRNALDFNGDGVPDPVLGTPAIGDVDGDGKNEVVWGGTDGRVYVVKGVDGSDKPGWPIYVRDTVASSPALFDMNGDGKLEVIIGVDSHTEPAVGTVAGGYLHVFLPTGQPTTDVYVSDPPGTRTLPAPELTGFPQYIDQTVWSAPSVGDIDGDGSPEIVVGTGPYYSTGSRKVYAFKCDGTAPPGWPVMVDGFVSSSPALADVNGDGILDVIITDDATPPSTSAHVYAFNGPTGALIWKVVPKSYFGTTPNAGTPIVADVLGDSKREVLVPVNTDVCVLDAATGTQLTESTATYNGKPSFYTPTSLSNVLVTDFESDGAAIEVVAVSATPFPSAADTLVTVFNPKATTAEGPWGFFRQNERRSGVAPATPACAPAAPPPSLSYTSLKPCRVLDTRDPTGPYGGPALSALGRRTFAVLGRCSIPADAKVLTVNLTAIEPTSLGGLKLFGGQGSAPNALVLLFKPGLTRAGQAMVEVIGGEITIESTQTSGSTHLALDVSGVFR